MKLVNKPTFYSFTGNPITFTVDAEGASIVKVLVKINLYQENFYLSAYPNSDGIAEFEISDLLKPYAQKITDNEETISHPYFDVLTIALYNGTIYLAAFTGFFLNGGISKKAIRKLNSLNTNIFDYRFLNLEANFLFTTRTANNTIDIYREELSSFFFISSITEQLFLKDKNSDAIFSLGSFDLNKNVLLNLYNAINSLGDKITSCTLSSSTRDFITFNIKDVLSQQKYILKFRNSFGFFEKILITGTGMDKNDFASENYNEFDPVLYDFVQTRDRVSRQNIIEIQSGYKTTEELTFMLDMISSDEIYFITENGEEQKCLVSCEDDSKSLRQIVPESLPLKIQFVDMNDKFNTPEIEGYYELIADNDFNGISTINDILISK